MPRATVALDMAQTSPADHAGFEAPRQARAIRTRDAIIDAAAAEFAEHGYQGASLSAILERSGVTKGALYFHFTSKESIALAIIDGMEVACRDLVARAAARPEDPLRRAATLARDVQDLLSGPPAVRAGQRLCSDGLAGAAREGWPWAYWQDVFADLFAQARDQGLVDQDADPVALGRFVVDFSGGAFAASLGVSGLADLAERIRHHWELMFAAVATPGWLTAWADEGGMATVLGPHLKPSGGGWVPAW